MHDAVSEALVNCLVNTDFYQPWSVIIEKYPDKITLANPGTIIAGKDQMLKGGISQPRNKGLFKMFNLIGYGEHAGLDVPVVEEKFGGGEPDRTIVTLPLTPISSVSKLDIRDMSRQEMMDFMGLSNRDHFSKHYIKPLIMANRLFMTKQIIPGFRKMKT